MPVPSDQSEFTVPGVGLYEYLYGSLTPDDEDRIAVVDLAEGTETTYATLRSHVDAAAGWLSRFGVRSGDVIALQCPNSEAFIVAAHAVGGSAPSSPRWRCTPLPSRSPTRSGIRGPHCF